MKEKSRLFCTTFSIFLFAACVGLAAAQETGATRRIPPAQSGTSLMPSMVVVCSGTIGDFVWLDLNRDGLQGPGEPGLNGVTVLLSNLAGSVNRTTTTSTGGSGSQLGYYQFNELCAGDYRIEVLTPSGFKPSPLCTSNEAAGDDSNCAPAFVNLPADYSSNQTIDFGFVALCTGTIGDFVWHDLNRNGIQDTDEPGIDGVTINLKDAFGAQTATTVTGVGPGEKHGYYQFAGICAGSYTVELVAPAGFSPAGPCSSDQTSPSDSNCSPAPITLPADNASNDTIDFGFVSPCSNTIGDFVWKDLNANGLQDADEPGINGVRVYLKDSSNAVIGVSDTAGGPDGRDGSYLFTGLCAGTYSLEVDTSTLPSLWYYPTLVEVDGDRGIDNNRNPSTVNLPVDDGADLTIDFGFIEGREAECPPPGVTGPSPAGTLFWYVDDVKNEIHIRYEQSRDLNDNSYGTNIVNWGSRHHNFSDLTGSDKAEFILRDRGGNLILDFFLDYLTSTMTAPASHYASLGPFGGDGSMVSGNPGYIKSWNTSLAKNLNESGFCSQGNCTIAGVNLLTNSPPTVSPTVYDLPPGSPFAAWDFTNAYEIVIDGAAFGGAQYFGSITVGPIHNSPSKTGVNAINPEPCLPVPPGSCSISTDAMTISSNTLKLPITNEGASPLTITSLYLSWPQSNGKLKAIKLDGDVVWSGPSLSPLTLSTANLVSEIKKKTIGVGVRRVFTLQFEKNASTNLGLYSGLISFGNGDDCGLNFPPPQPPADFCKSTPGSGKPKTLTMTYTGLNCVANCNSQAAGKVIVSGNPNGATSVYVVASDAGAPAVVFFSGPVNLGSSFDIAASAAGKTTLNTNTTVKIYTSPGGNLLSTVTFHTSCSQPLIRGDMYGSMLLQDFSR